MVLSPPQTRHHLTKTSRDVLAAADRAEPKIRRAMLAALQDLEGKVPDLTSLIEAGNTGAVMEAISGLTTDPKLVAAITDATVTSAVTAGMPEAARFGLAFNEPNKRAIRWAELNAAKNIKAGGVLPGVRDSIRQLVTVGVQNGVHPLITARMVEGMVPLLPRHAAAVERLATSSIEAGLSQSHIDKLVARKTKKLKRYRANMIARTEAIKAANMGQQLVWQTAIDEGLLPPGTKKVWSATGDSRTCPICAVMDGQVVEVQGEFKVDRQATGFTRSGADFKVAGTKPLKRSASPKTPPAHPMCRCSTVLETIPVPGRKPAKPKPAATKPPPKPKPRQKPTVRPDDFSTVGEAEDWLRAQGIDTVDLSGITRLESAREIGRAVETVNKNYPWYAERTRQPGQGLSRIVANDNATDRLNHFSAAAQTRRTRDGVEIALNGDVVNDSYLWDMFSAGDHSLYNTMIHEYGHAVHYEIATTDQVRGALSPTRFYYADGPWSNLKNGRGTFMNEVSMYADENGAEFFGEMFAIKNTTGYEARLAEAYWKRPKPPASAVRRLEAAERMIKENLAPFAEREGIDPGAIL